MKKNIKGDSIRRSPLMQRQEGLSFDNITPDELIALTPDEEAERFLSRWMEVVDPFNAFPRVFRAKNSSKSHDRVLLEVKRYYKHFVLEQGWSEQKYVLVINNIFETNSAFFENVLELHGKLYEQDDLLSQRRLRRKR